MANPKKGEYEYIREAFMVRRYHTVGHVTKEDTVGNHTANVLGIIFSIYDDNPPIHLVRYALHHDVSELATGDIPAPTKWASGELSAVLKKIEDGVAQRHGLFTGPLTDHEMAVMKFADIMDLCFKAVEEIAAGNIIFTGILVNGLSVARPLLQGMLKEVPQAHALYAILATNPFVTVGEIHEESRIISTRH